MNQYESRTQDPCRVRTPNQRLLASLALGLALLPACTSRVTPVPTNDVIQPRSSGELRFAVRGLPTERALAPHGVEFRLSGALEVGPAENGQIHRNTLPATETQKLEQAWNHWKESAAPATENCTALAPESPLANEAVRITIADDSREWALIRVDGGQICGNAESAQLLEMAALLTDFAHRHYPKVFPDACLAAADQLRESYADTQVCAEDAECVHISSELFQPIARGDVEYVSVSSCSPLPLLSAANPEKLAARRRQLESLRDSALKTCTAPVSCDAAAVFGFQNHRFPARCVSGRCVPGKLPR